MLRKNFITAAIFCLFIQLAFAQNPEAVHAYIHEYKEMAIEEMKRTGVPAAIKLAQGIHETDAGRSVLVKKSNNHFGIKCKTGWAGRSVKHTDDALNECFRKYNSASESYSNHSDFLKGSPRYASLFNLNPTDYEAWAYGLKKAGYATNPKYPQVIIKLIEAYGLQDYTLIALNQMPANNEVLVKSDIEKEQIISEPVFTGLNTGRSDKTETSEYKKIEEQKPAYPEGEFKINETRVVFVSRGTPYLTIAQQYNIPLSRIFEFNELSQSEATDKDRLIYIQRKRKTGNNEFHIVRPGVSLHDIAQEEAIRFETLLEYNMLSKEIQPAEGEKLYLRNMAPAIPKLSMKDKFTL